MSTIGELETLLAHAPYDSDVQFVGYSGEITKALESDSDTAIRLLMREILGASGKKRSVLTYILVQHLVSVGDLANIGILWAEDDPQVREAVLNGMAYAHCPNVEVETAIVNIAVAGSESPVPSIRKMTCHLLKERSTKEVDMTAAINSLYRLLSDESQAVRHMACYAIGHFAKISRYDLNRFIELLRDNAEHTHVHVRDAAGWALWQFSRHKYSIAIAVPQLLAILNDPDSYNEPRKKAVGALLHHAKKSAENAQSVLALVKQHPFDVRHKETLKFVEQLNALS
jgi:hypothetical protein